MAEHEPGYIGWEEVSGEQRFCVVDENSQLIEITRDGRVNIASHVLTGYVHGYEVNYLSASTVDILPGVCRNDADDGMIVSESTIVVDITDTGANGRDTGSESSGWWYVWVIYNPTTDTTAGLLSLSPTAPTLPSGYVRKRLVGAVYNESSLDFRPFRCRHAGHDREVMYLPTSLPGITVINSGSGNPTAWGTALDLSNHLPPVLANAAYLLTEFNPASHGNAVLYRPNDPPTSDIPPCGFRGIAGFWLNDTLTVPTNTATIEWIVTAATDYVIAYVRGYNMSLK